MYRSLLVGSVGRPMGRWNIRIMMYRLFLVVLGGRLRARRCRIGRMQAVRRLYLVVPLGSWRRSLKRWIVRIMMYRLVLVVPLGSFRRNR